MKERIRCIFSIHLSFDKPKNKIVKLPLLSIERRQDMTKDIDLCKQAESSNVAHGRNSI